MNKDTIQILASAGGLVMLSLTFIGLAARFILLPWLKTQLAEPVKDIHRQVTVNHHSSPEPTLLDRFDDIETKVDEARVEVRVMARSFDGHLEWSETEVGRMWDAIDELRNYKGRRG